MIAVDTNVLLRYVLNDDETQFDVASSFFSERTISDPAFVSLIVLCELACSLRRRYGFTADQVTSVVSTLVETAEVRIEDEAEVSPFILNAKRGTDIADLLIALRAKQSGCSATMTFDKRAAARIPGMELLT